MPLKKGNTNPAKNGYAHRGAFARFKASRNRSKTSKQTKQGRVRFAESSSVEAEKRLLRKPTPYPLSRSRTRKLKPKPSPKEASNQMRPPITAEALLKISSALQPNMSNNELNSLLKGIVLGINLSKNPGVRSPGGDLQATFNQSKHSNAGSLDGRTEVQIGPDATAIQSLTFAKVQPDNVAQGVDHGRFDATTSIQNVHRKWIKGSASPEGRTEVQSENLSPELDLDSVISATSFLSSRHSSGGLMSFVGWSDQEDKANSRG